MTLAFLAPPIKVQIKTKPKRWTIEHLIKFLETKDPNEQYCYVSTGNCLNAQYIRWAYKIPMLLCVGVDDYFAFPFWYGRIPEEFNTVAIQSPRTFGAALERARSYL